MIDSIWGIVVVECVENKALIDIRAAQKQLLEEQTDIDRYAFCHMERITGT